MTTPTRQGANELAVVEWLLRGAAVLAAAAALWMLLGANGLGLVSSYGRPGAPSDASLVMNERVTIEGEAGLATVRAANQQLGSLEQRSDAVAASGRRGPNLAEVEGPTDVTVQFWSPTGPQRWAWLLVRVVPAAFAAIGLWLLAALTRSAHRGSPFTRRNVHRLMLLTSLVAAGGLIGDWGAALVRMWLIDSSDLGSLVSPGAELSFAFLGVVLLLGVVTEVWRRGVAMREDLDGLV
ncbi:DUF2975 domain-containing protein [Angustibacter sp. Root456]|uniref:DUF2975 domain-containing protein n=1 Tax=Angustibacter sp. Root456 TaxID=1736539 RepID=UPI0006F44AFB|nr:DUF2975 domain-containing protein [Angustibacter sp. Root456]KQX66245.1 hypothetical protein ASD06_07720 [Angustibacter sp. Root456]